MVPIALSCDNHEGSGKVRIQQWEANTGNLYPIGSSLTALC
jgi:hypothetical protein